jgi:hypothetical protein
LGRREAQKQSHSPTRCQGQPIANPCPSHSKPMPNPVLTDTNPAPRFKRPHSIPMHIYIYIYTQFIHRFATPTTLIAESSGQLVFVFFLPRRCVPLLVLLPGGLLLPLIFSRVDVHQSRTEVLLWIRHGALRRSRECAVLIFSFPGCPWLPLAVPGCSRAAPGCSWAQFSNSTKYNLVLVVSTI